jgi:hypothetical protein
MEYTAETKTLISEYINSLNEKERKAYLIAQEHLLTSFDIVKSNGFKEFIKKRNNK